MGYTRADHTVAGRRSTALVYTRLSEYGKLSLCARVREGHAPMDS
jgi:hypothetical protein